jgi:Pao retrotransposon peptidase
VAAETVRGSQNFTKSDKLVISGKKLEMDVPVVTKRVILSLTRLFDPLGFAGPVVLTAKTILQQL